MLEGNCSMVTRQHTYAIVQWLYRKGDGGLFLSSDSACVLCSVESHYKGPFFFINKMDVLVKKCRTKSISFSWANLFPSLSGGGAGWGGRGEVLKEWSYQELFHLMFLNDKIPPCTENNDPTFEALLFSKANEKSSLENSFAPPKQHKQGNRYIVLSWSQLHSQSMIFIL